MSNGDDLPDVPGPQIAQRESDRQTMLSALERVKARGRGMAHATAEANMPASKVMEEFHKGTLHSGSSKGPIVKSPKQAKAIQISMARKEGHDIPKKHSGGVIESSGIYNLQKGETVIPAPPMKSMSHGPEKHTGAAENMGDWGPDESSVARANAPFRDLHKSGHDLNHTYKNPVAAIAPDVKAAGTNHSYLHPHSHAGMREAARTGFNNANRIKGMNEMGTGKT